MALISFHFTFVNVFLVPCFVLSWIDSAVYLKLLFIYLHKCGDSLNFVPRTLDQIE